MKILWSWNLQVFLIDEDAISEFLYDATNIPEVIRLADSKLFEVIYGKSSDSSTDIIDVNYDGRYWEDHQHAACVGKPNVCAITIIIDEGNKAANSDGKVESQITLIKMLPEAPVALKVSNLEFQEKDGVTYIYYEEE